MSEQIPILVIQVHEIGWMEAKDHFDKQGIVRDKEYTLFKTAGQKFMEAVVPGLPQLIFTSHTGSFDCRVVAKVVKEKNPNAIVFALTSSRVPDGFSMLDGVVNKGHDNSPQITGRMAQAFLTGARREELVKINR